MKQQPEDSSMAAIQTLAGPIPDLPERVAYVPWGFVMLRCPLLPIETVERLFDASGPEDCGDVIARTISDPVVLEALLASSPDLVSALPHLHAEPLSKRGRRVQAALFRYLLRMASRPTPFGLLAGVDFGRIDRQTDIEVRSAHRNRTHTEPDLRWLLEVVRELERLPDVADQLTFHTNPALLQIEDRFFLPFLRSEEQDGSREGASFRATPVVKRALIVARHGISLRKLQQEMESERPTASAAQIRAVLHGLHRTGAIVSDLTPPLTGELDPLSYVLERVPRVPSCESLYQQLRAMRLLIRAYDDQPIGTGAVTLRQIYNLASVTTPSVHRLEPPAINMVTAFDRKSVSDQVAADLSLAANLLMATSVAPAYMPHLSEYRQAFLERYGEGREVRLLALLDEHAGLGPPPYYRYPSPSRAFPGVSNSIQTTLRDRTLLTLASAALLDGVREVELNREILTKLEVRDGWWRRAPTSLEMYASVAATSQDAVNQGDYLVVIGARIGERPAGRSFARFTTLMPHEVAGRMDATHSPGHPLPADHIVAELVCMPSSGHAANIARRPFVSEYEIAVAVSTGSPRSTQIRLDDLVVGVEGDGFYLRSLSHKRRVAVCTTHLLNDASLPNVCRFLTELAVDGLNPLLPFDWGAASQLPFVPRLRYGRVVLSPAEWHLPTEIVLGKDTNDNDLARFRMQAWCEKWNVPRFVYLTKMDNRLLLDLQNPLSFEELRHACTKSASENGTVRLQEMLPRFDQIWIEGDQGRYLVEFIVPLQQHVQATTDDTRVERHTFIEPSEYLRQPGSGWLYFKLYCGRRQHEGLIGGPFYDLVSRLLRQGLIERWFFVRYSDPDPHIRVRFQGDPSVLVSDVLPMLFAWNQSLVDRGLVRTLVVDTYDQEIERYGGPLGVSVAEQVFGIDSQAVLDLTALRISRRLDVRLIDLALLTIDELLSALGMAPDDRLALYRFMRTGQQYIFDNQLDRLRREYHSFRPTAQQILGNHQWIRESVECPELATTLAYRAESLRPLGEQLSLLADSGQLKVPKPAFLASCVHMHCNRLLGTDRRLEFEALYILERTHESLTHYTPSGIKLR